MASVFLAFGNVKRKRLSSKVLLNEHATSVCDHHSKGHRKLFCIREEPSQKIPE